MIQLMTDSAADMDAEEYEKNGITCIPISVSFGDETYQESVNLTKKEFYRLQEQKTEFPKTAQPSPQAYLDAFRKAKDAGDETIFLSMSSRISSAYQSAVLAKNMLNYAACHIIDTCTATGGQRILLEHAALLRNVGVAAKAIVDAVSELKSRIVIYACMDTLENLRRGGRISRAAYALGTLANIKPILHVTEDGQVTIPGRAQGMKRGMSFMLKKLAKAIGFDHKTQMPICMNKYGNTSSVSIPLTISSELQEPTDHIFMIGMGAGLASGIADINLAGLKNYGVIEMVL